MRANLRWDNPEKTIVRCDILHGWTWDDLHAVLDSLDRLSERRGLRVHALIDLRGAEPVANHELFRLSVMESGKSFARRALAHGSALVLVGGSAMVRAMYLRFHLAQSSAPAPVRFAADPDGARRLLELAHVRDVVYAAVASA